MIERYEDKFIAEIFSLKARFEGFQEVELAIAWAQTELGKIPAKGYEEMSAILLKIPVDVAWINERERAIKHDYNAFVEERRRHLPIALQQYFHMDTTTYDGQEAAFARSLLKASQYIEEKLGGFLKALNELAIAHRFTLKLGRTHGQWGELCTFGSEVLTWKALLRTPLSMLRHAVHECEQSRIAGAMGNYGPNLSPVIEKLALERLRLRVFPNPTQVIPRTVYAPLAQMIGDIALAIDEIANDIRLSARSGFTTLQEYFDVEQKGSTAMPHKRNPINCEQMEGIQRMVIGFSDMVRSNIRTWEKRTIEQSSVERVAWPDLFHGIVRILSVMTRTISKLEVYPDVMLQEIVAARGTYATNGAKGFLAKHLDRLSAEESYRVVQLASFNVFDPGETWLSLRMRKNSAPEDMDRALAQALEIPSVETTSIQHLLMRGQLRPTSRLKTATAEKVEQWNEMLRNFFAAPQTVEKWNALFTPSALLPHDSYLYEQGLSW